MFSHNPHYPESLAKLLLNISSVSWVGFAGFSLWFILVFTEKKKILQKKWLYPLIFGIPLFLIYKQWTNSLMVGFSKEYFGWKPHYTDSVWPYLFTFYCFVYLVLALYIDFRFIKTTSNAIKRKQASVILITVLATTILGFFTDIFFPLLGVDQIPNIADSIVLIWAFGLVYAMVRYKFLSITPATAAENIISTMHDVLILLNMEGKIEMVNKAGLDLLGCERAELKGTPLRSLLTAEAIKNGWPEKILGKCNLKNEELMLKNRQGEEIPVIFSSSVLVDDAGVPGGFVAVAKDISERKKLEAEIIKSKKLESIGLLAGGIAHDFNNLLSIILGNIELTKTRIPPGDEMHIVLEELEKVSLKGTELTSKFITFSRWGGMNMEKAVFADILSEVMELEPEWSLANNEVAYDIDIPKNLEPIYGDPFQLRLLLQNLLLNAIEADPGGEGVKISVWAGNTAITSDHLLLKPGKYVKVVIRDNGIGIPRENIDKVFDPYFSTKEKFAQKGLGLGLTLCYSIITKHEGHIEVESEEGKGTQVTLYLPVFEAPPV
jgi:PAS domain S-box-containing protein